MVVDLFKFKNVFIEMFVGDIIVFCIGDIVDEVLFNIQKVIIDLNIWVKFNFMIIYFIMIEFMFLFKLLFIGFLL